LVFMQFSSNAPLMLDSKPFPTNTCFSCITFCKSLSLTVSHFLHHCLPHPVNVRWVSCSNECCIQIGR
jgi:hypothetical protein